MKKRFSRPLFLRPVLMLGTLLMTAAAPLTVSAAPARADYSQLAEAPVALRYQVGQSYAYQWSAQVNGRTQNEDAKQGVGTAENTTQFNALARVTPVRQLDGENFLLAVTLEQPRVLRAEEGGKLVEEERDPNLEKELLRPVYFRQSIYGQVGEIYVYAKEDPGTANLKRGVISALNLSTQSGEREEQDISGIYRAKYESYSEGGQLVVNKRRTQDDYLVFADGNQKERAFLFQSTSSTTVGGKYGVLDSFRTQDFASSTSQEKNPYTGENFAMVSELVSGGQMQLVAVEKGYQPEPGSDYVKGGLMATAYDDGAGRDDGATPKQTRAQLGADLSLLQKDPSRPESFNQLLQTLSTHPTAVRELGAAMRQGALSPAVLSAAIGALGSLGTDEAQTVLLDTVLYSARPSPEAMDQALVGLSLAARPLPAAVAAVERMSLDGSHTHRTQALMVLGAMAERLADTRPLEADRLVRGLERQLQAAQDTNEQEHLVTALGNAGHPASVEVLAPFLDSSSPLMRGAAAEAMRKMQSPLVDSLLLVRYDREPEAWLRALIVSVQERRARPTPGQVNKSLTYYWSWTRDVGGNDIKARLFAELDVRDTPDLYVKAQGQATAHAWSWQYTLLKAWALSDVVTQNGVIKRRFGAYLDLLNNRYFTREYFLTCGQTQSGSLGSFTLQFFNLSQSFYPWGIRVTLGIRASGTVDGTYSYQFTACNAPVRLAAQVTVTPGARITAVGGVSVSIYVARAGAEITADILKTTLPATATGEINYGTLRTCQSLRLNMQPISGNLSLWYQTRRWNLSWGSRHSWNVWSFGSSSYSTTLYNRCWP